MNGWAAPDGEKLFWRLLSWGPGRPPLAEVVLGRETLARLIFHHGKCKVHERWDEAGGSDSVPLGIVLSGRNRTNDLPKGFHVFGVAPRWNTGRKQTPDFNSDYFSIS